MAEVEVDEVLRLCFGREGPMLLANGMTRSRKCHYIPWVTKLPKLRPTMQCQVGPFLSSNYGRYVSQKAGFGVSSDTHTVRLM